MSASTFKKLSAVAVTAALAMAGLSVAHAGPIPPYKTGFEPTADTVSQDPFGDNPTNTTYAPGNLIGQGGFTDLSPGTGSVSIVSSAGTGIHTQPLKTQVVQSVAQNGAGGGAFADAYSTDTVFTTSQIASNFGGVVSVTFDMARNGGAGKSSGFGVEILSKNQDAVLASLFLGNNATDNTPALLVAKDGDGYVPNTYAGFGRNDGNWGTYNISLDFNTNTFTVFVDGNAAYSQGFAMDAAALAEGGIGGIAFANTNDGGDTAFYDNLRVVPEPAGVAMVGLGTLLLLAKRPKRLA